MGTRAVEQEGLTTQQWAVLGPLSREKAQGGMGIGDLARYLMVSRQNLSGFISRMERDGHVSVAPSGQDRRSRVVTMHYLLKMLENMQRLDTERHAAEDAD